MSAFSRWTSLIASTARRSICPRKWVNPFPAPVPLGGRRLVSLPGSQKQRQRVSRVRDWTQEREHFKGKPYPCNVTIFPENRVWMGYVVFRLPRHVHFDNDKVDVYIEFSPPSIRHPSCFAVKARPDDPASRLALRVKGVILGLGPYTQYVHSVGEAVVFKANALADMLLDESATREEIMQRPRRAWESKQARRPRRKKAALKGA